MTFPISVHAENGQFRASMVGEDSVFAIGATREEAISSVEKEIAKRLASGELVALKDNEEGLPGLFGKYAGDEELSKICDEAYAERDRDRERQSSDQFRHGRTYRVAPRSA